MSGRVVGSVLDVRRGRRYENFFGIPVPIIPWICPLQREVSIISPNAMGPDSWQYVEHIAECSQCQCPVWQWPGHCMAAPETLWVSAAGLQTMKLQSKVSRYLEYL